MDLLNWNLMMELLGTPADEWMYYLLSVLLDNIYSKVQGFCTCLAPFTWLLSARSPNTVYIFYQANRHVEIYTVHLSAFRLGRYCCPVCRHTCHRVLCGPHISAAIHSSLAIFGMCILMVQRCAWAYLILLISAWECCRDIPPWLHSIFVYVHACVVFSDIYKHVVLSGLPLVFIPDLQVLRQSVPAVCWLTVLVEMSVSFIHGSVHCGHCSYFCNPVVGNWRLKLHLPKCSER